MTGQRMPAIRGWHLFKGGKGTRRKNGALPSQQPRTHWRTQTSIRTGTLYDRTRTNTVLNVPSFYARTHSARTRPRVFQMEDEWEEEEQLVVVELSGIINNDFMAKCRGKCKILGIDSEKPMMQVGQYVFAGEYEDALGTCVLFEETPQKEKAGSVPELKYICHTAKKLMMQRVFLVEKKEGATSTESGEQLDGSCQPNQPGETAGNIDGTDLEDAAVG
uniref:Transcription factor TFIIIC triple barrel domain-containing protein n=2 Tax=Gasterosteus aculeatus aculeatus TaxID=481459 RepID=A0AAQ4QF13_GASAC